MGRVAAGAVVCVVVRAWAAERRRRAVVAAGRRWGVGAMAGCGAAVVVEARGYCGGWYAEPLYVHVIERKERTSGRERGFRLYYTILCYIISAMANSFWRW
jgi:peptide methionine sulfoxide reductase MsrA